jgi:predicted NBD/HSP70 family sugar kinase
VKTLAGSNTSSIRAHNVRAVLHHVLREGGASRAHLAARTSLSNTAIGNVVAELLEQRILTEANGDERATEFVEDTRRMNRNGHTHLGRPRTRLRLVPDARFAIATHIGIGTLRVAVVNLKAEIVCSKMAAFDTATPAARILERIAQISERLVADAGIDRERVLGLGVGASGLVDPATGVNVLAPNLGWRDVPVRDHLHKRLNLPVVVDNNVRAMALGEAMFGAGQGINTLAFVYGRVGVGAGFVVNGNLFRGSGAGAGEIGHTTLLINGRLSELEEVVSERVLIRYAQAVARRKPKGTLARHLNLGTRQKDIERIFAAARAGDSDAMALIAQQAAYLGYALANLVNVLNPDLILLGGMFADGSDLFLPIAEKTLRERAFAGLGEKVQVQPSSFGWRAGVVGAGALALAELFFEMG